MAVAQREIGELRAVAEEDAANLCLRVLQVEVAVTGRRAREVRDLAADPHETEMPSRRSRAELTSSDTGTTAEPA
jgi:hypothetical protein